MTTCILPYNFLLPLVMMVGCPTPAVSPDVDSGYTLEDADSAEADSPRWSQVTVGDFQTCALNGAGGIECWGGERLDGYADTGTWVDYNDDEPPAGIFQSVVLSTGGVGEPGSWHGCALDGVGAVTCWGRNDEGQASPPPGEYTALALSSFFSCGLTEDGYIDCWGRPDIESFTPTDGGYVDLAAGDYQACAVSAGGGIVCWNIAETQIERSGAFTEVGVYGLTCAAASDGPISCWVRNDGPEVNPVDLPTGMGYVDLCVGWGDDGCALSADGSVECWGYDEVDVPDAHFTQLSCGPFHVCGLTDDSDILCWGVCLDGQCEVPP